MTLLSIVQDAADEIGIPPPQTVVENTDPNVTQLLRMVTRHGRWLLARHDWQDLLDEGRLTATGAEDEGSMATITQDTEWLYVVPGTMFNRTQNKPIHGPMTPAQWQREQATTGSLLDSHFRIRGSQLLFQPVLEVGDSVRFEFITKSFVTNLGSPVPAFGSDTDTVTFDEELMTLGLVVRYLKAKGLDYSEQFREHEILLSKAITRDGGFPPKINLARQVRDQNPKYINFPDGSWPLS